MRQWRVGTLSMGLLLLASGVGLLWAQFQPLPVVEAAWRWWPLLFIVLGLEVLTYTYLQKDDRPRVRYDGFSIVIILLLIFTGMGLRTIQEIGLTQYLKDQLQTNSYTMPIARKEIAINEQIQKVVLSGGDCSNMEIRTSRSSSLLIGGDAQVRAKSKEEAQQQAEEALRLDTRQDGTTLYVNLNGTMNLQPQVVIPSQLGMEVNSGNGNVSVLADEINNDWLLRSSDRCEINLPAQADLLVTVMGDRPLNLKGNIPWNQSRTGTDETASPTAKASGSTQSRGGDADQQVRENNGFFEDQVSLGKATHRFTVITKEGEVNIKQLP